MAAANPQMTGTTTITKLPKLPENARVTKRPLLRPAIPSPYSGASQQKVVYVSAKTPFLAAVKRVEKLLKLADKRLVQSATTVAQSNRRKRGRQRNGQDDEIGDVAAEVERMKSKRRKVGGGHSQEVNSLDAPDDGMEEVTLKATGKAIQKGLELAEWFRKRDREYVVRLKTGSVKAIDDVEIPEVALQQRLEAEPGDRPTDAVSTEQDTEQKEIPETRVRYTSVLEVRISLV